MTPGLLVVRNQTPKNGFDFSILLILPASLSSSPRQEQGHLCNQTQRPPWITLRSCSLRIRFTSEKEDLFYSSSSSSSSAVGKKRLWKQGEFPGTSAEGRSRKTPIKNIKKKLDRKNDAKAWANTVAEALSDLVLKKQWLQALEVFFSSLVHFLFLHYNHF